MNKDKSQELSLSFSYRFLSKNINSFFLEHKKNQTNSNSKLVNWEVFEKEVDERLNSLSNLYMYNNSYFGLFVKKEEIKQLNKNRQQLEVPVNEMKIPQFNDLGQSDGVHKYIEKTIELERDEERIKRDSIILVKGPIGSYKNRLVQYLYLKLLCQNKYPVFYIDFSYYEQYDYSELDKIVDEDIQIILNAIEEIGTDEIPMFVIGNLRNYDVGIDKKVIMKYKKLLFTRKNLNSDEETYKLYNTPVTKCLISMDHSFLSTRYYLNPLLDYFYDDLFLVDRPNVTHSFKINSIDLKDKKKSEQIIRDSLIYFVKYDNLNIGDKNLVIKELLNADSAKERVDNIWKKLRDLNLTTADPFTLKYVFPLLYPKDVTANSVKTWISYAETGDLKSIYDTLTFNLNLDKNDLSALFGYETGITSFNNDEEVFNFNKTIGKSNRSVVDYQMAKYYVERLRYIFKEYIRWPDPGLLLNDIKGISIIFTRNINRFILSMLKKDDFEDMSNFLLGSAKYLLDNWVGNFLCELIYLISFCPNYKDASFSNIVVLKKILNIVNQRIEQANDNSGKNSKKHKRLITKENVIYTKFVRRSLLIALARANEPEKLITYVVETFIRPYSEKGQDIVQDNDYINLDCGFNLNYYGDLDDICCKEKANIPAMKDHLGLGNTTFTQLYLGSKDCFEFSKNNEIILPKNKKDSSILIYKIMAFINLFKRRETVIDPNYPINQYATELISKLHTALKNLDNSDMGVRNILSIELTPINNKKKAYEILIDELYSVFYTIGGNGDIKYKNKDEKSK